MRVIEIFESINGEGLKQGQVALFIRLAGCNLRCSYCDTRYSFENPCYKEMSVEEIVSEANKSGIVNITLTGGEPLIHKDVHELIKALAESGHMVEIETNGSVNIKPFLDIKNVSFTLDYKCPTSLEEAKMDLSNYEYINKKDSVKFVVGNKEDLAKALEIMKKYDLINKTNCLISPVFGSIDPKDIVSFLVDNKLNGARIQLQIHKFIWDPNLRGV